MSRTPEVEINEAVTPVARVHDTYVRPEEPARSPLHDVAESLRNLNPKLDAMFGALDEQDKKNQEAQAIADFWTGNQEGAAEATRNGSIPTFANPHYTRAYKAAAGAAAGIQLEGQLGLLYTKSNIKTSDDPAAYDNWFRGAVKETLGDIKDPGVLRGLVPHLHSLNSKFQQQFTKDRSEYVSGVAVGKTIALSGSIIDKHLVDGALEPEGYSLPSLAENLQTVRDNAYKSGMEKSKVDKLLIDVIVDKAESNRDARLLGLLDTVVDENGLSLSKTEYGLDIGRKATQRIQGAIHMEETQAAARQAAADKKLKDAKTAEYFQELRKNPNYQPSEQWLREMEKVDPDFSKGIAANRQALLDQGKVQDPRVVMDGLREIYAGRGRQFIRDAWQRADLKDPAALEKLEAAQEKYEKQAASGAPFLEQPGMKMLREQIKVRGKDMKFPGAFGGPGDALVPAAREALDWADQEALDWATKNPDLARDPKATGEFISNLRERILDNFHLPEMANELPPEQRPSFTPPGTAGSIGLDGKPVSPGAAVPRQSAVTQQAPTPPPKTWEQTLWDSPAAPTVRDLSAFPPALVDRIRAQAKKEGVTVDQKLDAMWQNVKRLREQGVGPKKSSGAPGSDTPGSTNAPSTQKPSGGPTAPKKKSSSLEIPGLGRVSLDALPEEARTYLRNAGLQVQDTEDTAQQPTPQQQQQESTMGNTNNAGDLSAKHESAKAGSAAIAHDDTGGWSYGRYQFASGGTTADGSAMRAFIKTLKQTSPELGAKLEAAGGAEAAKQGTPAFKTAWVVASKDPAFRQAEEAVAQQQLVGPAAKLVGERTGLDVMARTKALQEVLHSTAIQHGGNGAARLWQNALKGKDPSKMTDAQIINALYDERSKVDIYFRSSTPAVKRAVANRFKTERRDALAMLSSTNGNRDA